MGRLTATTVYLDERQKTALHRLAKAKGSQFSREIRAAIQEHLAGRGQGAEGPTPEELIRLAGEADRSLRRMLKRLDETNRRVDAVIRTVRRSNQRALGGHR
jgi:hypothetical protein